MKHLSRADEILMVSILCLGPEAYSTRILEKVRSRGGKTLTVGSLWVSLDQLAGKGYVRKQSSKGKAQGGGRPRIYYRLTPKGVRMLERMRSFQQALWKGAPPLSSYDTG